jgi:hypothetical protein
MHWRSARGSLTLSLVLRLSWSAVLQLLKVMLEGTLRFIDRMFHVTLISLQEQRGGVRPIGIAEVWHRLVALCTVYGCAAGLGLHALQLRVGIAGSSSCVGPALCAGMDATGNCDGLLQFIQHPPLRRSTSSCS